MRWIRGVPKPRLFNFPKLVILHPRRNVPKHLNKNVKNPGQKHIVDQCLSYFLHVAKCQGIDIRSHWLSSL
jgi:hypothetical protein